MKLLHDNAQVTSETLNSARETLGSYIETLKKTQKDNLFEQPESFVNLPFLEKTVTEALEMKKKMATENLKYVVVVGIGGSDLGTRAIYDALYGYFDEIEPIRFPKAIFLETTNPKQLAKIKEFLNKIKNPKNVLINVVSKSGKTLETITNLELLLSEVPYAKDRLVITTSEKSDLYKKATEMEIEVLGMPEAISGRYSVFTNVGIFPLLAIGIDILKILEGAMKATIENLEISTSNAIFSSTFLKQGYDNGRNIHNMFVFEPELESLGKWYEQLMAESVGKDGKGITPTTSIGSTDLHSEGQLDLGGPEDKLFTFVWSEYKEMSLKIPEDTVLDMLDEIPGKNIIKIERAILQASKGIYEKHGIPVMGIELESITPFALGEFMQYKMIEIALLGKLFEVNAFNQPNVEEYKIDTKKILSD